MSIRGRCLYSKILSEVFLNPSYLESCLEPGFAGWGARNCSLPETATRAVQTGALGQSKGQAVLEPAHVDGRGAPHQTGHGHLLPRPAHQAVPAVGCWLDGWRNWGCTKRKETQLGWRMLEEQLGSPAGWLYRLLSRPQHAPLQSPWWGPSDLCLLPPESWGSCASDLRAR